MNLYTRKRRKGETADEYIASAYQRNKDAIDSILAPNLRQGQSAQEIFKGLVKNAQIDLRQDNRRSDLASAIKAVGRSSFFDPDKNYAADNFLRGLQKRGRLDEFAELADLRVQKRNQGRFAGYTSGTQQFEASKLREWRDNAFIYDNKVLIEYDGSLDQIVFTPITPDFVQQWEDIV